MSDEYPPTLSMLSAMNESPTATFPFCFIASSRKSATFFGGWRIVRTMASGITKLRPYQGFSAETAASTVLTATAQFGVPVSTTHTISGSIMGAGAAHRMSAVRWGVGRRIVAAWVLTIPAAATISGAIFWTYLHLLSRLVHGRHI